ncbi:MAG TPA: hypothetical protein VFE12_16040 [Acetobacteraceae bacterium]|jgi:hypothetical protein|nr:hypothetical protein [Acetobacteraceae bacterium]
MANFRVESPAGVLNSREGARRSLGGQPHLVLVSPDHPRIMVLVTPWPKLRGRAQLNRTQRAEIAIVRQMLAPFLLILRGAAWIDPQTGRVTRLQRLRLPWLQRLQARCLMVEL